MTQPDFSFHAHNYRLVVPVMLCFHAIKAAEVALDPDASDFQREEARVPKVDDIETVRQRFREHTLPICLRAGVLAVVIERGSMWVEVLVRRGQTPENVMDAARAALAGTRLTVSL